MVGTQVPVNDLSVPNPASVVATGESIASEGKGDYMYVEGRVLSTDGKPIEGAVIETWETDGSGERPSTKIVGLKS